MKAILRVYITYLDDRFGSDVVDKAKNVTQKCVVAKLTLFYPDGSEAESRPVTSRLYRPESSEDFKNNGEDAGAADINRVVRERNELRERMVDIEKKLVESEQFCSSFVVKQDAENWESRDGFETHEAAMRAHVNGRGGSLGEGALVGHEGQARRFPVKSALVFSGSEVLAHGLHVIPV